MRTTKILRPISRHRIAQILPAIHCGSRATRPGMAVGIIRMLYNGLCTSRCFFFEDDDQNGRSGCQDQQDGLRHHNQCPRLAAIFTNFWKYTSIRLGHELLLIDLITHSICPVRFTSSTARLVAGAKLSLKADLRAAQSIPRGLSDGTQVSLSHPQTIGTSCETYACDFVRNRTHKTKTRAEARCVTHRLLSRRCDGAT